MTRRPPNILAWLFLLALGSLCHVHCYGQTTQPTTAPTTQPAWPTAVITVTAGQQIIAGQVTQVQALNSTVGVGTAVTTHFDWDFGDPAGAHNTLTGFNAAHLYEKPGTYTVSLTVTNEAGQASIATTTIAVAEDKRPSIYVSATGSDASSGATPDAPITITKLLTLTPDNVKVLFHAGERLLLPKQLHVGKSNVMLGRYGTGEPPVLLWSGPRVQDVMVSIGGFNDVVRDLTFDTPFTSDFLQIGVPHAVSAGGTNVAVVGCQFLNIGYGVNANVDPTGLLVQDCIAPTPRDVRGVAVWLQGTDLVLVGNVFGGSAQESVIRGHGTRVLIADNNLTNPGKACIVANVGSWWYVAGNKITTGGLGFGPISNEQPAAIAAKAERIAYVVAERNEITDTSLQLSAGTAHAVVRDNVFRYHDRAALTVAGYIPTYDRIVSDARVLNNTAINTGTTGQFLKLFGPAAGLDVENNLLVAPNTIVGQTDTAPLSIAQTNLASFSRIANNIWGKPSSVSWRTPGAAFYLSSAIDDLHGWVTLSDWNAKAQVHNDQIVPVALAAGHTDFASNGVIAGQRSIPTVVGVSVLLSDGSTIIAAPGSIGVTVHYPRGVNVDLPAMNYYGPSGSN